MKIATYLYATFISLMACVPITSYAELTLDRSITPKQAFNKLNPVISKIIRPYAATHTYAWPSGLNKDTTRFYANGAAYSDPTYFSWQFNGHQYYSAITSLNSDFVPLADCKHDYANPLADNCDWINIRQQTCHLFMLNPDLSVNAVAPINIIRVKGRLVGKPRCDYVDAISIAKEVSDAMLVTLEYSDSAAPADPRNDPQEFITTVLLRFSEQNGKLKIEQDDGCLGNPNQFKTIAAARKALKQCAAAQHQTQ